MLVAPASNTKEITMRKNVTVYVRLLDEGTDAWRPVPARLLADGHYEILEIDGGVPSDEKWEFQPGTQVTCRQKEFADGTISLIAVALA